MRKYQQLLIGALGLISFICFLIYKHEYDRLRYVLENLNVFGNPPSVMPPPGSSEAKNPDMSNLIQPPIADNRA
jgi:hypothetical protein